MPYSGTSVDAAAAFAGRVGDVWIDTTNPDRPVIRYCVATSPAVVFEGPGSLLTRIAAVLPGSLARPIVVPIPSAPDSLALLPSYVNSVLLPALRANLFTVASAISSAFQTVDAVRNNLASGKAFE